MAKSKIKFLKRIYCFECKMSNGTIFYPMIDSVGKNKNLRYYRKVAEKEVMDYEKVIREYGGKRK